MGRDLQERGVQVIAIPRQAKISPGRRTIERGRGFRGLVKWCTGCEGRISYLKRGYGWDCTRLGSRHKPRSGADTEYSAHELVKISALAS